MEEDSRKLCRGGVWADKLLELLAGEFGCGVKWG